MATAARPDVEKQKRRDRRRKGNQAALIARMVAVLRAQEALARRERGAGYALRAAYVDLAAIAELLAADLPRPRV